MSDRLEARLRAVDVEWPRTPDLAGAVVARLQAAPARGAPAAPFGRLRRLGLVVALALLVPAAGAVAFPSARDDVLEWVGIKGATITRTARLPPANVPTPDELGRAVSLGEAARLAGFRPRTAGPPREVRYDPDSRFVTLLYDGFLVAQARGALTGELLRKMVDTGTGVSPIDVGGARGAYIDRDHTYLYERPGRVVVEDFPRRAHRALVVSDGDLLFRIEGPARDEALAIARRLLR
jgi:hypothetical protein